MESNAPQVFEFGDFKIDIRRRLLYKKNLPVNISSKNFELLYYLVQNEGRILSHDELLDAVWEGTFVEQSNLKKGISALRHILGETPDSSLYIKTIPRKGYSFVASVRAISTDSSNQLFQFAATETIIEEEIIEDDEPQILPGKAQLQLDGKTNSGNTKYLVVGSIVFAVLLLSGFFWWYFLSNPKTTFFSEIRSETIKPQRLSTNGDVSEICISPDGKFFVYAIQEDDGKQSLWLRRIGATNPISLISPALVNFTGIVVSPENDLIYYTTSSEKNFYSLYQIPILGGSSRKITDNISSTITFSPDKQKIAFARDLVGKGRSLVIFDLQSNKEEKEIFEVSGDNHGLISPKWSPDGKKFVFIASEKLSTGRVWTIREIPVEGGTPRNIIKPQKGKIYDVEWLNDQSGFIVSSDLDDARQSQIFKINYANGEKIRVTNDLMDYASFSLSTDGKSILVAQEERKADLWTAAFPKFNEAVQLTKNISLPFRFKTLPDGNYLGEVVENGIQTLSIIDQNTGNAQPFLQQPDVDRSPSVSPDGNTIIFLSRRSGSDQIWQTDINGNNPQKLTDEKSFIFNPRFSPDGNNIYFERYGETFYNLVKIPREGGESTIVFPESSSYYDISADGKFLTHGSYEEKTRKWKILLRSFPDMAIIKVFDAANSGFIKFTPDGNGLLFTPSEALQDGGNLWLQPIDGTPAKPLFELKGDRIFWADFSQDGKKIAFTRGQSKSSAVLLRIENQK
jgi:Tol biopolymer transport system component/DNA-binding winged helix-turn-helix (wHTH) protein